MTTHEDDILTTWAGVAVVLSTAIATFAILTLIGCASLVHSAVNPQVSSCSFAHDEAASVRDNDLAHSRAALLCGKRQSFSEDATIFWLDRATSMQSELDRVTLLWILQDAVAASLDSDLLTWDAKNIGRAVMLTAGGLGDIDEDAVRADAKVIGASAEEIEHLFGKLPELRDTYAKVVSKLDAAQARFPEIEAARAAAREAYSAFDEVVDKDAELFRLAYSIEDAALAARRSGFDGCADKMRDGYLGWMVKQGPRSKEEVRAAAHSGPGQLLQSAAVACERGLGNELYAKGLLLDPGPSVVRRGPATDAALAASQVFARAKHEFERFPIASWDPWGIGGMELPPSAMSLATSSSADAYASAVVAKLEPLDGGVTRIAFDKGSYQRPIYECVYSNKIERIHPDGRVEYQSRCAITGYKREDVHEQETVFPSVFLKGVSKGDLMRFSTDGQDAGRAGFPVWVSRGKKDALVSFGGIPTT